MPAVEVGHGGIACKSGAVEVPHRRIDHEADEGQAVRGQEGLDVRNAELMLLDVEDEIAAGAGRIEIPEPGDLLERFRVVERHKLLTAAADVVGGMPKPALCDELARQSD